jgi:hypothetical protein
MLRAIPTKKSTNHKQHPLKAICRSSKSSRNLDLNMVSLISQLMSNKIIQILIILAHFLGLFKTRQSISLKVIKAIWGMMNIKKMDFMKMI